MRCNRTTELLSRCQCGACSVAKSRREAWFGHVSDCGLCARAVLGREFWLMCESGDKLRSAAKERTRWRP